MKFLYFVFLLPLMFTSMVGNAQKGEQIIEVTAIRLTEKGALPYQTKHKGPNFDVDTKGILRADKGYVIEYRPTEKKFVIRPSEVAFSLEGGFDIEQIPGGVMYCMCDQGNDDCEIQLNMTDGQLHYFCQGSCGCINFSVCDDLGVIKQYETPGGGWFNL